MTNIVIIAYQPSRIRPDDSYDSSIRTWISLDFDFAIESDREPIVRSAAEFIAVADFQEAHKEPGDKSHTWEMVVLINGRVAIENDEFGLYEGDLSAEDIQLLNMIQDARKTARMRLEHAYQKQVEANRDRVEQLRMERERETRRQLYKTLKKEFDP